MTGNTKNSIALNRPAFSGIGFTRPAAPPALPCEVYLGEDIRIRPYHEPDQEGIRQLCCDTGFFGEPVDKLFRDRDLFADLFTRQYLKYEADWGMVAEAEGRVVGYLLGSVRRYFDWLQMWSGFRTSSRMVFRLLAGRYAKHPRSRRFVRWLFTAGLREQPKHPPNAAHLHFDIDKRFRGRGIGRKLWEVYERRLREAGVRQCYGAFFSHPKRRPEAVYARFGFAVFDRRPTTLFEPEMAEPVEVVCMAKQL